MAPTEPMVSMPAPPGLVDPPFHIGIVVDDIDVAMAGYGGALGLRWAKVCRAEYTYCTPDALVPTHHRYTYSVGQAPHIELIEGAEGSIWAPSTSAGLHHLGYWAEDLPATSAALAAAGSPLGATRGRPGDPPSVFAYHRAPGSPVWIELVDVKLKAAFAPWLAGGDMGRSRPSRAVARTSAVPVS